MSSSGSVPGVLLLTQAACCGPSLGADEVPTGPRVVVAGPENEVDIGTIPRSHINGVGPVAGRVTLVYEVVIPLVEAALRVMRADLVEVWKKPGELVGSRGTGRPASDVVSRAVLGVDPHYSNRPARPRLSSCLCRPFPSRPIAALRGTPADPPDSSWIDSPTIGTKAPAP